MWRSKQNSQEGRRIIRQDHVDINQYQAQAWFIKSSTSGGEVEGYERRNDCGNPTTTYIINERIGS
jgi:hypothetical protein